MPLILLIENKISVISGIFYIVFVGTNNYFTATTEISTLAFSGNFTT